MVAVLGGVVGTAGASVAQPSGAPQPVTLETIAGTTETAVDVRFADGALHLRLNDGATRAVALSDVSVVRFGGVGAAPSGWTPSRLWLRSGQELPGRCHSGSLDAVVWEVPGMREPIEVAWRFVRGIRVDAGDDPLEPAFGERLAVPSADRDALFATGADGRVQRVSVRIHGVDGDKLVADFGGQRRTIPMDRVYGVVFADRAGAAPDRQARPRVVAELVGGGAVAGKLIGLGDVEVRVRLDEAIAIRVARPLVATLRVESDHVRLLSDLTPVVEQTPALDRAWPPLVNRGQDGGLIRLGGRTYATGLVLFPRTRLTYALEGEFALFEAVIGMADGAGAEANAVFRVWGDGQELFSSGEVTAAVPPRKLRIPIAGCARLVIEADFGRGLDIGDACVFAQPRLRNE